MLDVNIYKTLNKLTLNAKKSDNTALPCLRETREWNTCFGHRNSKIVYQNSMLSTIPIFNMIKVKRYGNQGKISRTSSKSVNPKTKIDTGSPTLTTDQNLACITSFKRRNKPQNVLNISRGTSFMASDTQHS